MQLNKFLKHNKEFVLSNQVLKSGTSIGANITEVQAAQSTKDFISKMSIAPKEARETDYLLRLLDKSGYISKFKSRDILFDQIRSIVKMLTCIIKTTQEKLQK